MIRGVIFDFGGVLIDDPSPQITKRYTKILGVDKRKYLTAITPYFTSLFRGTFTEKELHTRLQKKLGTNVPLRKLSYRRVFARIYSPKKAVLNMARALKEKKYKLAILSNIESTITDYPQRKTYRFFDEIILSCNIHMIKPEKQIYNYALKKIKLPAKETVFIDDKIKNVREAKKLGMHAILFKNPRQVRKDLAQLGVNV